MHRPYYSSSSLIASFVRTGETVPSENSDMGKGLSTVNLWPVPSLALRLSIVRGYVYGERTGLVEYPLPCSSRALPHESNTKVKK